MEGFSLFTSQDRLRPLLHEGRGRCFKGFSFDRTVRHFLLQPLLLEHPVSSLIFSKKSVLDSLEPVNHQFDRMIFKTHESSESRTAACGIYVLPLFKESCKDVSSCINYEVKKYHYMIDSD